MGRSRQFRAEYGFLVGGHGFELSQTVCLHEVAGQGPDRLGEYFLLRSNLRPSRAGGGPSERSLERFTFAEAEEGPILFWV